jgi:hypothetical protein
MLGELAGRSRAVLAVAVGEDGEAGRHVDVHLGCVRALEVLVVVVAAHRGTDVRGQPVDRQVGEDLVASESRLDLAAAVAEGAEEVDDPGCEPRRRVGEPVGNGLRLRRLHPRVRDVFCAFARARLEELAQRRRPRFRRRAQVEGAQIDADQVLGMPSAELNRHTRADVAAVSAESCVAETIPHQPTPHVGDRPFEHRRGHRVGEAVAGQRGDDDVESVFGAPAVGQRVGQERQEVEMLEERAREAMGEDDRKRSRPRSRARG